MEFGGVGSPAGCLPDGRDRAATAAKVSRPDQKVVSYGFGMSTEAVMPAKAMVMLEVLLLLLLLLPIAIADLFGCFCAVCQILVVFVADDSVRGRRSR